MSAREQNSSAHKPSAKRHLVDEPSPRIVLADVPAELRGPLSEFDLNGDGVISCGELSNAAALYRSDDRRASRSLTVGVVLLLVICCTSVIVTSLGIAWYENHKEIEVRDGVLYDAEKTNTVVATSRSVSQKLIGQLPAYKGKIDYSLIDSLTIENVPPTDVTLGFRVESFTWFNMSAMDLYLSLGYVMRIRNGRWSLDLVRTDDAESSPRRRLSLWGDAFHDVSSTVSSTITAVGSVVEGSGIIADTLWTDGGIGRICGQFCGPGWCAGQKQDEDTCDSQAVQPETGSCADACCQAHDQCCRNGYEGIINLSGYKECDTIIVACLDGCASDSTCTAPDGDNFPPRAVEAAMGVANDLGFCCGHSC